MSLVQKKQEKIWFNKTKQSIQTRPFLQQCDEMVTCDGLHVNNASNCMCEGQRVIFTQCDKQVYNRGTALIRRTKSLKPQNLSLL